MDYTSSNAYATDAGTGQRLHQQSAAIPTAVTDTDMNGPIWELLAVIKAGGIAPAAFDKTNPATYTQVAQAIQSGKLFSAAAAGTADAITAAFTPAITALKDGMALYVRSAFANLTSTPTFTPNSGTIPAKGIVKGAGSALAPGDIAGAGHWVEYQYDLTLDKWVLLNPATGVFGTATTSLQGAFKKLKASATGLNATVSVSADEIILENASNTYQTLRGVNLTVAGTSTGVPNGLDTGALAASTWYSLWVIWNGTTAAGLLSLSETAPTMPAGYTHKARVGWIRTDGSANKYPLSFIQLGRRVQYKVAAGTNVTSMPLMASGVAGSLPVYGPVTWAAVATGAFVPPTANQIRLLPTWTSGTAGIAVAPSAEYGATNVSTNPAPIWLWSNSSSWQTVSPADLMLESANVYWASQAANAYLWCMGWEDNL